MACMVPTGTSSSQCANGVTWRVLDTATQVLVVNTRTVNYSVAVDCCQENFGQLVKIDSEYKSTVLTAFLEGLCIFY